MTVQNYVQQVFFMNFLPQSVQESLVDTSTYISGESSSGFLKVGGRFEGRPALLHGSTL